MFDTEPNNLINNTRDLLITHQRGDLLSLNDIETELAEIRNRIYTTHKNDNELIEILDQLSKFELGRFLIKNKGSLSGWWTYYIILGYREKIIHNELEFFLLNKAPSILATRERFQIFQNLLIKNIKDNSLVCSVPCGLMADLITLNISRKLKNVKFCGVDLDESILEAASNFAKIMKKQTQCSFIKSDAWEMKAIQKFDIVTSNGLNIYEKNSDRIIELYQRIFTSLKPGGLFIGSALSAPPGISEKSEWTIEKIIKEDIERQKKVFSEVLQAAWQNFRHSEESLHQLQRAGFQEVNFYPDERNIFYTFLAKKPIF